MRRKQSRSGKRGQYDAQRRTEPADSGLTVDRLLVEGGDLNRSPFLLSPCGWGRQLVFLAIAAKSSSYQRLHWHRVGQNSRKSLINNENLLTYCMNTAY